jgi:hypothetical protein
LEDPPDPNPERALLYGLMMQRRGFNYERLLRDPARRPNIAGIQLEDASETVRKLSDARLQFLKGRLTR